MYAIKEKRRNLRKMELAEWSSSNKFYISSWGNWSNWRVGGPIEKVHSWLRSCVQYFVNFGLKFRSELFQKLQGLDRIFHLWSSSRSNQSRTDMFVINWPSNCKMIQFETHRIGYLWEILQFLNSFLSRKFIVVKIFKKIHGKIEIWVSKSVEFILRNSIQVLSR